MERRLSWCTIAILFVLLFVTSEALRGQTSQVEEQRSQTFGNRGTAKFDGKLLDKYETTSAASSLRSRSNRERKGETRRVSNNDRQVSRNSDNVKESFGSRDRSVADKKNNPEQLTDSRARSSRRNERRYLPEQNQKQISRRIDQEATLEAPRLRKENNASRRVSSKVESIKKGNDQQLNVNTGPSVFSGTTENSRSRTGRKIHTSYTDKELKKELPVSRRFNSESSTNSTRKNSSSRGSRKDSERGIKTTEDSMQLTESESVRVDIPLILATTDYPKLTTVINDPAENQYSSSRSSSRNAERRNDDREYSRSNIKDSRNSDRTKNRRKSNDEVATSNSRSVQSRRGSSKFVDFTTPETIETVTTRSKNRNDGRSSRNHVDKKSRTRDRSLDIVSRSITNGVSEQAEIKRRSSGDRNSRNPEIKSRSVDTVQDNRGRSRGRIRAETTTPKLIDFPTAIPIEMTTGTLEYTTLPVPEVPISTTRSTGQRESARTVTEGPSRVRSRIRAVSQGGRNSTKEDYFNHGLGFRGRKFPTDEITSSPNKPIKTSSTQVRGNPGWTLRRRPGHLDKIETSSSNSTTVKEQTNEIISVDDKSINTESTTIVPTTRRGSKKLKIDESTTSTVASTTKNQNPRRGSSKIVEQINPVKDSEESDNYPPDFKARLSQLKNSNPKIAVTKSSTPRTSTEDSSKEMDNFFNMIRGKKSSSTLFSERSKMKLELARRLVKPELNDQENVLDLTGKSKTTDMPIAEETKKVDKLVAKVSKTSRMDDQRKLDKLEENSSRQKKGRIISERTVTSISVQDDTPNYVVETVTKVTEEIFSTRKSKTQDLSSITSKPLKGFNSTPRSAIKEFKSNNLLARRNKSLERDSNNGLLTDIHVDTSKIKSNKQQSFSIIENEENQTKKPRMLNSVTKANFQTRYPKKLIKDKIVEDTNEIPEQTTSRTSSVTSRYSRKKVDIFKPFDPIPKTITTVTSTSSKRREFRPRTATYRRHSEIPTTSVQSTNKVDINSGVAITPKTPKYHATLKSSTPTTRSIPQEPQVSVRISNDTNSIESGITDSSNGNTGSSNIFNPTRSAFLSGNSTLLEQLRSTVAPLLSSLGNKTPIFAGSYSNVNNGSSTPRITPSGSPPRFSARYKGAELFVRKSTGYQATVPSITSSSTTQITPIENIGSALPPPIDISSPGEPKFLTYYQALESASIQNEQGDSQQQRLNDTVTQVDSNNATNGTNGNANSNNDTTSPTNVETASPQTPNTTNTQPDNLSNENLNQDMENPSTVTTEGLPESLNASTTVEPLESMIETNTTTTELSTSAAVVEEMSTTQDSPISTDPVDTLSSTPTMEPTSMIVTSMNDALTTTVTQSSDSVETMSSSTDVVSTTESITIESRLVDLPETTEVTNNMDTTPITSTTQNVENSSAPSDSTTIVPTESTTSQASSIVSTTSSIETSTESIESNIIEQSDVTLSSSTESNDFTSTIRTTTDLPIVTTFRTRLIDFAQDILSRLQSSIGLTTLPPTLTTTPAATTEIPTTTSDLDTNIISNNPVESTTIVQQQETTTVSDDITSVSMDASTQEAVGFNDSETNTLETVEISSTTDSSTTASAESSDLTLDIELLTQPVSSISLENESSVNITTPESPINSTEMTTFLPTTLQDSTLESTITDAPNDTLLTELMTLAKSLFSEAMNETSLQTKLDNISITIDSERNVENIESSLTTDSSTTVINIDNGSLNDSTTENVAEFSTEVLSEQVETTTISSEREEETTLAIDLSENEIESTTPFSPTTITNTEIVDDSLALNVTQNEVEFIQTNDTSFELGTTLENVEITTTTEPPIENEIGIVPNEEFENITESSVEIMQDAETTTVSTADLESTTLSYDFQSTTTQTQTTTLVGNIDISVSSTPSMVAESLTTTTVVNDDELSTRNPLDTDTEIPTSTTEITLSSANIELLTQSTVINDRSSTNLVSTEPMSTTTITEPTTATEIVTNNDDISTSQAPEIIITETITEQALDESIESNRTNQTIEMTSTEMVVNDAEVTTNPPLLTTDTDLLNLTNITGTITTNRPIETTTTIILTDPSLSPLDFMNTTPTDIDRLQDATPATAQGTAASGTMQFDQMNETTIIPSTIITESPTTTTSDSSNSLITESSSSGTSTSIDTTTTATTTTTIMTTMTPTTTTTMTTTTMTTPASSTTTDRPPETTTATESTTSAMQSTEDNIDINDNLISTEASTSISTMSASTTLSPDVSNSISRMDTNVETTTMDLMAETTTTPAPSSTAATTTTTAPSTTSQTIPSMPQLSSESPVTTQATFTSPYVGRFGGSRLTPAPRFSPSSSTRVPLRDYHVYGIYPNKTIVRKRPEDNLIDARNVDSPYVIFGIYPDGRLVRKFPNGTIIPDPPSNPVEVVFSLSTTTTTNRPPPVFFYNQANQGTFNQYQAPSYYNNRRPVANLMTNAQNFGTVDLGLTGNAISGSNGGGADFLGPLGTPGSVATTNTMGSGQNGINGRIFQDRQRDEGSRSRESAGQRNSVYIGQDRFVNYWTNGAPSTNPRVVSVNINSVANAASEGPASSSRIPSFDNLLNGQSNGDQMTAPPGFLWRDPLDQIFGITTNSPIITASIASNTLDDSNESSPTFDARPVGPFVEVFTPVSGMASSSPPTAEMPSSTTTTTTTTPAPTTTTTTTTTPAPTTTTTTTTTTPAPTTTTTTTTTTPTTTTTTTTPAPTTTTTTTTTPAPTTTTTTTTTTPAPTTTTTTTTPAPTTVTLQATTPINMRTQNAFGTTFDDLAFLNSLLQPNDGPTTQKTLNDVEKLLANKIISLALNNAGPTRSPKAIQFANASPNSIEVSPVTEASSSAPIIIDLLPSSTTKATTISSSTLKPISTTPTIIGKPIKISDLAASAQTHSSAVSSSTTKSPMIVTAKSIPSKPKTTTSAPVQGIGASLLQALFGGNFFGPSTTARPVKTTPRPIKTTPRIVEITQRPIVTTQSSIIPRMVNISDITIDTTKPTTSTTTTTTTTTLKPVTTTKQVLLNNPNPRLPNVISSTYSPEDDAKFLAALFNSLQQSNKKNQKPGTPVPTSALDDEAFLRAILSGQAKVPLVTTTRSPEINNAALLAALLKAQGIEPSTPATNLREQLQLASLEKNLVSLPPSTTSTPRPTTTARPTSTTGRPSSTSRPRLQTTTWSPSSTYPPPLFSGFANFVNPLQNAQNNNNDVGGEGARNQVVNVALGATRAFSQFLGAAITGAAQQLQSFVRNGTRIVSEAVG
ncbi:PREDICTED: uncharacterized threonine-rich GPI-anchored glycoprotein PJ4664.02-like [Polistes dominula]|uniref:Uncharacterized threonine-rich GPI-anchored glycoprotein PJ4664.02-like n=1 Tax=Polistes dominula TaxID=743375 RepID=A0ABM1J0T6_POLDO|nr:PREDICTED: uncharacterized threonine-rich GPI-anchored glycoprotein PJ4664.02-like [Polistes dominula]